MNRDELTELLCRVRDGELDIEEASDRLKYLPYTDLGFAMPDTHRAIRQGFAEVVMGEGKRPEDIVKIIGELAAGGNNVLITRVDADKADEIRRLMDGMVYYERARCLFFEQQPVEKTGIGTVLVVSAGTSDLPVAEEAALVCEMMGNDVTRLYDVGVAGLHRLMGHMDLIRRANVLIVVAGMEGALPSVIGGIVDRPVVAVPTSVGYGTSFGGLTALLGMLNSCAAGVCVVNIDNGFGAGYIASLINRKHEGI
ncbi:MAG: nickel pincer cofactor biosynthesis protein LarB [Deltaproteobacteria bacterium]|nr:nickel pincer cofactor biosynthesis protein LarB [Candidatus Zymogenaceae bacterium]